MYLGGNHRNHKVGEPLFFKFSFLVSQQDNLDRLRTFGSPREVSVNVSKEVLL